MRIIALEEAIYISEAAAQAAYHAKPGTGTGLADMLLDIHGEAPEVMDKYSAERLVFV